MNDPYDDPYLPPRAPVGFQARDKPTTPGIDGNPWLTIWTRPRSTIREIVDSDPSRRVALLSIIWGISSTIERSIQRNSGDFFSMPTLLAIFLIGGAIGGLLWNSIMGTLVRWTGSWLGGVGSFDECRAALAWGAVPQAVILLLMFVLTAIFGHDMFRSGGIQEGEVGKAVVLLSIGVIQIILGCWSGFLMIKCVAEVHRFSAWKGLGAFLLVVLVLIGIVLLLVFLVIALSAMMK